MSSSSLWDGGLLYAGWFDAYVILVMNFLASFCLLKFKAFLEIPFDAYLVRVAMHPVFHRDRRIGRRDGQVLRQDGMKKLRSFGACDEFCCRLIFSTKPKRFSDAQSIFTVGQPVQSVKRRVVERWWLPLSEKKYT